MTGTWEAALESAVRRGTLTTTQGAHLRSYLEDQIALRGPSPRTLLQRVWEFSILLPLLGDSPTVQSFKAAAVIIRSRYAINHQRILFTLMKSFARYLDEEGLGEVFAIRIPGAVWDSKKAGDLLTREEVHQVIAAGKTVRDRAILALMYDGSLRPIEIRTMMWRALTFDEYGCKIKVRQKTKYERTIRLTLSLPYMLRWRENYPLEILPENPVFLSEKKPHSPLGPYAVPEMVRELARALSMPKLTPSIFRPSRITHDVEDGFNLGYIAMKNWGNMATPMLRVYAKPSEKFMDEEALQRAGIKAMGEDLQKIREACAATWAPQICPACETLNPPGMSHCGRCMQPLTEEAISERKAARRYLSENPQILIEFLNEKRKDL